MHVNIGDTVRAGDTLFEDKKNAGVAICTPVSGEITDINRGEKRKLLSIEIEVNNSLESLQFSEKNSLDLLIKSGCFSYFKTRPFNRIPKINSKPNAIFINCCDSNPLAINPQTIIDLEDDLFHIDVGKLNSKTSLFYLTDKGATTFKIDGKETTVEAKQNRMDS